jgi:histone acetyltransferase (RNA polymerase elongator complex component)
MKRRETPFIVPIFIPQQGCRHQCVFCNQSAITGHPVTWPSRETLRNEADRYLTYNRHNKPSVMAFYGGNFLGLSEEKINQLLQLADEFIRKGNIRGIRFSTRPDTISESSLKQLENFPVSEIELGVQSMDDKVLNICRRGHCASDTKNAVALLKNHRYKVGLQLMIGLPGQTAESVFDTAEQIVALSPDFIRIYPTVVLNQSVLSRWYQEGKYHPLLLKEAVFQTKKIYLAFKNSGIPVIRMGLQASQDLDDKKNVIAGPYHPAFGHLVFSAIFMDTICTYYQQYPPLQNKVEIVANPKCISRIRGINNENIRNLKTRFNLDEITVKSDSSLSTEGLSIDHHWIDMN